MDIMYSVQVLGVVVVVVIFIVVGFLALISRFYHKAQQGQALVRNGIGGTKVSFSGIIVIPILHKIQYMDIFVKTVIIDRHGKEGLICMDNMRADIKVNFFVRVNKTVVDVIKVANIIGCERASDLETLRELFEAKFSEALKTVGKQFNFVDLYNSREQFKDEILKIIGTDLNGFVLDDAAIDYLEQTAITNLNPDNILDSEGIKKIIGLTAEQKIRANEIEREEEKTLRRQDVEAKEAILELNKQLAESENKQTREIESIKAREEAEVKKVQEEERLKAENARIAADEEIHVAEENKERQVIVARKNKERTEAIETERVEKDRALEEVERERVVALNLIEKEKAVEEEKKNIQDVIRERVMVERTVVEEKERIKDTEEFATAERAKKVAIVNAEKDAEEVMVTEVQTAEASRQSAAIKAEEKLNTEVKAAEASRKAAELKAQEIVVEAEAYQTASEKKAEAKKLLADAFAAEKAAPGLADARVMRAKNELIERKGAAEAKVLTMKYSAEAEGIENKANAMKLLDAVGREHEEFKLELDVEKSVKLARIDNGKKIARYHSQILGEALKTAKVDIVGGESEFFDKIIHAVSAGKSFDRLVDSSHALTNVKETFFNSDPEYFKTRLRTFFRRFGVSAGDVKDLTISAALSRMISTSDDPDQLDALHTLVAMAKRTGLGENRIGALGLFSPGKAAEKS